VTHAVWRKREETTIKQGDNFMKKHMLLTVVNSVLLGLVFTIGLRGEEVIPEFDGGYLKTANSEYVEMTAKRVETNVFETIHFVRDKAGMITMPTDEFKGIFIQGRHKFELFSLHPLLRKISSDNIVYYAPGEKIETLSKFISDNANYFQPREELKDGEYVAWISQTFWLFSLSSEEKLETTTSSLSEEAASLYDTAMYFVHSLEDKGMRINLGNYGLWKADMDKFSLFIDMAATLAIVNDAEKSREAFNNALEILHSTDMARDWNGMRKALVTLTQAGELDRALELASYGEPQDNALLIIVFTLVAEKNPDDALVIAKSIEETTIKISALQEIIPLFVKAKQMDKAMECFSIIEGFEGRVFERERAIALAKIGRVDEAIAMAGQITDSPGVILANAALSLAESGNRERAYRVFDQALDAAQANAWEIHYTMQELREIALALLQADDMEEKANEVIREIVSAAKLSNNPSFKNRILVQIMEECLNIGKPDKALMFTDLITEAIVRANILQLISKDFARRNEIDKAMEIAHSIQDSEFLKASAFVGIATALAKSGDLDKALGLIYSIEAPLRNTLSGDIITALAGSGYIDDALKIAGTFDRKEVAFSKVAVETISLNLEASQQKVIVDKIMTSYLDANTRTNRIEMENR
jgi:tetratricopeptide (TPR) repeat protein